MEEKLLKLVPKEELNETLERDAVIRELEEALSQARAGKVKGILLILTDPENGVEFNRCGIPHERAVYLYGRAVYKINRELDEQFHSTISH